MEPSEDLLQQERSRPGFIERFRVFWPHGRKMPSYCEPGKVLESGELLLLMLRGGRIDSPVYLRHPAAGSGINLAEWILLLEER